MIVTFKLNHQGVRKLNIICSKVIFLLLAISYNLFLKSNLNAFTFAHIIGPRFLIGVKREVRLDSGAIPVAVISFLIHQLGKEKSYISRHCLA